MMTSSTSYWEMVLLRFVNNVKGRKQADLKTNISLAVNEEVKGNQVYVTVILFYHDMRKLREKFLNKNVNHSGKNFKRYFCRVIFSQENNHIVLLIIPREALSIS